MHKVLWKDMRCLAKHYAISADSIYHTDATAQSLTGLQTLFPSLWLVSLLSTVSSFPS
jgi:hypothetical protein